MKTSWKKRALEAEQRAREIDIINHRLARENEQMKEQLVKLHAFRQEAMNTYIKSVAIINEAVGRVVGEIGR